MLVGSKLLINEQIKCPMNGTIWFFLNLDISCKITVIIWSLCLGVRKQIENHSYQIMKPLLLRGLLKV